MNTHKNARLTFARRLEMVQEITESVSSVPQAAADHGVTTPTVRKWLGRYLAGGAPVLADASSRPACSPRAIAPATALLIVELRQQRLLQRQIARQVGVSASTVSRVLARAGLSRLSDLQPREPVQRYEHEAPGDLLHIDIKKLSRIARPGHRVTGNRRDTVDGAGWEYLFVAVDDHARIAYTAMHPDETRRSAVQFLRDAVAWYAGLGVRVRRLLTDNVLTLNATLAVRRGGRVILMGGLRGVEGDLGLNYHWLMRNETTVCGVWMYSREVIPRMVQMVRAGLIDLGQFEVAEFSLDDTNEAVAYAVAHAGPRQLTVLRPDGVRKVKR